MTDQRPTDPHGRAMHRIGFGQGYTAAISEIYDLLFELPASARREKEALRGALDHLRAREAEATAKHAV